MPKDTKSLGNNKAPACESRGFVRKKQKVCILTHLPVNKIKAVKRQMYNRAGIKLLRAKIIYSQ
ncbi:hypothetical protein F3B50_07280 [Bacteroides ovatus]|nr:hypothetical protein F3B50_07280 [Bacteroides ovatus]